jgi:predicted transcriptional regulator
MVNVHLGDYEKKLKDLARREERTITAILKRAIDLYIKKNKED